MYIKYEETFKIMNHYLIYFVKNVVTKVQFIHILLKLITVLVIIGAHPLC